MAEGERELKILRANESNNAARIVKTVAEKDALSMLTGDSNKAAIDDVLRLRIEENTQELYKTAKDLNNNS